MTTISRAAAHVAAPPRDRVYLRSAVVCLAIAVAGFVPSFWAPLASGTIGVPRLAYLHALLVYLWLALFIRQTMLAAAGRIDHHKAWGVFGAAVVGAMVVVSLGLTIFTIKRHEAAGFADQGHAFAIIPVTAILTFAGLFAAALLNTHRPDFHKRIMLVANAALLLPAIARLVRLLAAAPSGEPAGPPPVPFSIVPSMLGNLVIVAAMIHDRRTTGRVHPAYWWAGGALLAVQIARIPLSTLTAWHDVARWLVSMAP